MVSQAQFKNIAVFSNVRPRDREVADQLRSALIAAGFRPDKEPYDLVVSVGGDGTFLESVRRFMDLGIPFAGVNTGSLGFLQELTPEDLPHMIDCLTGNQYRIEQSPLLEAEAVTASGTLRIRAFNDVVIEREATRALHLEAVVNQRTCLEVAGDGVIFSTAAGSTAYAAAAGGPYIHPTAPVFQMVPISPHSSEVYRSLSKPLVFPAETRITLSPRKDKRRRARVVADGAPFIRGGFDQISVGLGPGSLCLVRFRDHSFCERISAKLMGGGGRWGSGCEG